MTHACGSPTCWCRGVLASNARDFDAFPVMLRKQEMLEFLVHANAIRADEMSSLRKLKFEELCERVRLVKSLMEPRRGDALPSMSHGGERATRGVAAGKDLEQRARSISPYSPPRRAVSPATPLRSVFRVSTTSARWEQMYPQPQPSALPSSQMGFYVDKGTGRAYVNYNTRVPQHHVVQSLSASWRSAGSGPVDQGPWGGCRATTHVNQTRRWLDPDRARRHHPHNAKQRPKIAKELSMKEIREHAQQEAKLRFAEQQADASRAAQKVLEAPRGRKHVMVLNSDKVGLSKRLTVKLGMSDLHAAEHNAIIKQMVNRFSQHVMPLRNQVERDAMARAAKICIGCNRDTDQSLSTEEIAIVLSEWGFDEKDVGFFLVAFDKDGSGTVTMDEFLVKCLEMMRERKPGLLSQRCMQMLELLSKTGDLLTIVSEDGSQAKLTYGEFNHLQYSTRFVDVTCDGLFELIFAFGKLIHKLHAKNNRDAARSLAMEQVFNDSRDSLALQP